MMVYREIQSVPAGSVVSRNSAVSIRPVLPEDTTIAQSFFRSLSSNARYNRFMAPFQHAPKGWIERFSQRSCKSHASLIACHFIEGKELMIGEAQYTVDGCGSSAEFALCVADDWQNNGIGTQLLHRLETCAKQAAVTSLYCFTLGANYPMRRVLNKTGFQFKALCAGCLRFEKTLQPIEA